MKKTGFFSLTFAFLCVCILFFTSCINTKKIVYFNNIPDTVLSASAEGVEPVIQKGDLLSISVSSLSTDVTAIFNAPNTPSSTNYISSNTLAQAVGYLVSQDGYIDFPLLGSLKVTGFTKQQLKDSLTHQLEEKKLLFDPTVTVRYLNFHVTVLGEVNRPSLLTIPNEEVTVLEAIGMAGDLTIYGKRDNVLLIRRENGQKIVRRLNLNSESMLTSPYYNLKSNDVIYVEPSKNKVASASESRLFLPILFSALSFLTIFVDRVVAK